MKLFQIFNKTPNYKKFSYTPRFYNPADEERKERNADIEREINKAKKEVVAKSSDTPDFSHRTRIQNSFRQARQSYGVSSTTNSSTVLIRFLILLILTVGVIGYTTYGNSALYAVPLAILPLYLFMRFRKQKNSQE